MELHQGENTPVTEIDGGLASEDMKCSSSIGKVAQLYVVTVLDNEAQHIGPRSRGSRLRDRKRKGICRMCPWIREAESASYDIVGYPTNHIYSTAYHQS